MNTLLIRLRLKKAEELGVKVTFLAGADFEIMSENTLTAKNSSELIE